MRKRLLFTVCAMATFCVTYALTLDECQQLARDNYPAIKQYDLITASKKYDLSNASKAWLPQISVQANAFGFTDILNTESPISQMGMNLENYLVSGNVTIQQTLYDGGQTSAYKRVISANSQIEAHQTDITLYNVRTRTEELYFSILLIDEQLKQNEILQSDLNISIKTVEKMISGGIANQGDLDALRVELLNAQQQQDAYEALRNAYLKMLSTFIGKELSDDTDFKKPTTTTIEIGDGSLRPEMALFTSQENVLEARRKQLYSTFRPTIGLMGMGLLRTEISDLMNNTMLIAGLSVKWNISSIYTRKNDIHKIENQKQQINVQRKTFLFQNQLQQEQTHGTITALQRQIESDNEIVNLRENIRKATNRKVESGTENVTELVRDINAVNRALCQKAIHEIQLLKAIYELKNLNGE